MFKKKKIIDSEEINKNIIDNIRIGISVINPSMQILTLNRQMQQWFPNIDISKRPICYEVFNEPAGKKVCSYCPVFLTLQDGQVHEAITNTPRGDEVRHYRLISSPLKDKKGNVIAAIEMVDDITSRIQMEEELIFRIQADRMVDSISSGFINLSSEQIDNGINKALETVVKFLGVDRGLIFLLSIDGKRLELNNCWQATGIELHSSLPKTIFLGAFPWLNSKINSQEIINISDISTLGIEAETEKLEFQSQSIKSLIYIPMVSGGVLVGVLRFDSIHDIKIWLFRMISGIFVNVLERKRAEEELKNAYLALQRTQKELIQTEKLAAIGRFSSGVAHEVRNPLGIILGGIEYLDKILPSKDEKIKEVLEKIKISTLRAENIVEGLLRFSRPSELKKTRLKLNELIQEVLSLVTYRAPLQKIKLQTEFSSDDLFIEVDRSQIQQVFFNILINAIESMPNGGIVSIKTYQIDNLDVSQTSQNCVTEIKDTGIGISKDDLKRIFEPFFTTKRDRKGTGLGLSICKKIIDDHNGTITIESEKDKGTIVKVLLPLA